MESEIHTNEHVNETEADAQTEHRLVVAEGEGESRETDGEFGVSRSKLSRIG